MQSKSLHIFNAIHQLFILLTSFYFQIWTTPIFCSMFVVLCRELGCRSLLVVTDAGVSRLGLTRPVLEGAERAGLRVSLYDEVTSSHLHNK